MAKLDRPLYGENATGTLFRVLSYRRTENPEDLPGEIPVSLGTVVKIPFMSCRPSPDQVIQRNRYAAAVAAWNALSDVVKLSWAFYKPTNLTGFNFFIRLYFLPNIAFLNYCVFGLAWFQLATAPGQPAAIDYYELFPEALDEFPIMRAGADSPQAWTLNRAYSAMLNIQGYLILHRASIEG